MAVRVLVLRHYGAVHVTLLPNRVISVFFSARFFTPKASEVPIPWVYTECFVESSTDDSPVPPARQPPASTLPWQTPPCSSPDLPIRSLPPAYTFHWATTQPAQHILCVRQPNQTHHLHRQRTKKKKKRNIRSPVPGAPPSRSCSSTLTDSIRRPQCSSDVIGQSRYNLGCRPGIALDIGRGPAGKSNSGF